MDTGFRRVTDDELALVRSCRLDERCLIYDNEFLKLHISTIASMLESAFNSACADALRLAGSRFEGRKFHVEVDPLAVGQTWIRVVLTAMNGEQFSAIGLIPDPRIH